MNKYLDDYEWGLGIEHEMHIFHQPPPTDDNIKDFILFDSKNIVDKILYDKNNRNHN
jgi:hypothetical protein